MISFPSSPKEETSIYFVDCEKRKTVLGTDGLALRLPELANSSISNTHAKMGVIGPAIIGSKPNKIIARTC